MSTVAPLDYLGCLLLKFIDEAIVDGLQGRSLLHYTCSDLGLDVFQGGLGRLFLLLIDMRRLLLVEMCWVLSYRGLKWVDRLGRGLKDDIITAGTVIPGVVLTTG